MPRANEEIVRDLFAAFSAHDMEAFLANVAPDVEFEPLLREAEGGERYRGHEAVRGYYETVFRTFPDMAAGVLDVDDRGSVTLAKVRVHAQAAGSGGSVEQVTWLVGNLRDGKVTCWAFFASRQEALAAAGLSE